MMRAAIIMAAMLLGAPATSESGRDLARDASVMLLAAGDRLAAAESASDRIAALSETVRAYETGLSAMRTGLRHAELRERELSEKLNGEDRDIASLLALLQSASNHTESRVMLHPGSSADTIRAGTLASMLIPSLHQRAALIEDDLVELADLTEVQRAGHALLEDSLAGIRDARLALARAVSNRTDLPERVATDDAAMQALLNSAETLSAFADNLLNESVATSARPGKPWPLPVRGELLRGFNEPDTTGQRRPGWVIATEAQALVTAPSDATVRFSGEIPGEGLVTILEPHGGALMILAGLGQSFVQRDQIVARNEPIGFMGRNNPPTQENLNDNQDESSLLRAETLYMEIRQGRAPVDPADLLTLVQE